MPSTAAFTRAFAILGIAAIVLGLLWWLQGVLVPIALAIFLTFLLSPPVTLLQRRGVPRALAVVSMMLVAIALLVGIGWTVAWQATSFADAAPQYEKNINAKLSTLRSEPNGVIDKVQRAVSRISRQVERAEGRLMPTETGVAPPQPVRVVQDGGPLGIGRLWSVVSPIAEPLATAGLTLVLAIFMLLRREDLRDRTISLFGHTRLVATTKVLDEAGVRISRFLLTQLAVNASYGAALALGLTLIGVPYALLWGFLAALLRYVPYLGPAVAAVPPLVLSVLIGADWTPTLMVLALVLVLELISNMIIEPIFYGRHIGVSELGTIVMIAFWTWLWGPMGLLLATPLTVCLVVLGAHIPFLSFLHILLGDRPVLTPATRFYQRLLAKDAVEAGQVVDQQLALAPLPEVADRLMLRALSRAKRDLQLRALPPEDEAFVVSTVAHMGEALAQDPAHAPQCAADQQPCTPPMPVLAFPARTGAEPVALGLLHAVLDTQRFDLIVASPDLLAAEAVALAARHPDAALIIGVLPPAGVGQANLLCVRLRAAFPTRKLIVACFGAPNDEVDGLRDQLIGAGADRVTTTLVATGQALLALRQQVLHLAPPSAATPQERALRAADEQDEALETASGSEAHAERGLAAPAAPPRGEPPSPAAAERSEPPAITIPPGGGPVPATP